MYSLSLEIINKCNLNCSYCYLGDKKNKKISWETAKKSIEMATHEALKQYDKTLHIYFIGGEPLLLFDFIQELVSYSNELCSSLGLHTLYSITTNGVLLTSEIMDFFIKEKFNFKVSIDGTEIAHDLNRKDYTGKGSYKTIIDKLHLIEKYERDTKKRASVAHVVTPNNVKYFYESFQQLQRLGFKFIETGINHGEKWEAREMEILMEQIEESFMYYYKIKSKGSSLYWKFLEDNLKNYYTSVPFFRCKAGLCSIYVTVEGDYFPCKEMDRTVQIGTVDEGLDVDKIRMFARMNKTKSSQCLKCEYEKKCVASGCIMENFYENHNFYDPIDIDCKVTKKFYNLIETKINERQKEAFKNFYLNRGIQNGELKQVTSI